MKNSQQIVFLAVALKMMAYGNGGDDLRVAHGAGYASAKLSKYKSRDVKDLRYCCELR